MPICTPLPLSVVIITLNEERRIGACLDSVRALTDDVIVVDAQSRDATCAIARQHGARVFERPWPGYSEQKNFGSVQARHAWILSLDADERVTPELAAALRREFEQGPRCDAYAIRFENYFGDRRIRFGAWNPEWHVRLFDRRQLEWNADDVHEGLTAAGAVRTGRLDGCIRHLTVESAGQLAEKTERYSTLFARRAQRAARAPHWGKIWLNPGWRFFRDYVVRLGLLDGGPGAVIAWEAARYTHLKYARARPTRRPMRRLDWLTLAAGCALLTLALARMPMSRLRFPSAPPPAASFAAWDEDDDETDWPTLAYDADDDVLV